MRTYTTQRQPSWETLQRGAYTATAALCACALFLGLYGMVFLGTVPRSPETASASPVRFARLGLRPPHLRPAPPRQQSADLRFAVQRYALLQQWQVRRGRAKHWGGK